MRSSNWKEQFDPEDIKWRIEKLRKLYEEAKSHTVVLGGESLGLKENGDLRYRVFHHIRNNINVADTLSVFVLKMLDDEFWKDQRHMTERDKALTVKNIDTSIYRMYFIEIYMCVENLFRAILRAIDPNACTKVTGGFPCVYKKVLSTILPDGTHSELHTLLPLYHIMRNGIHNNYDHTGESQIVSWLGKEYKFVKGQPIKHHNWQLTIKMTDLIIFSLRVLVDKSLSSVDLIPDTYDDI